MAQTNSLNKSSEDFTVDNLFIDGNSITSTSGVVTIQPLAGQDINLTSDNVLQTYSAAGSNVTTAITNSDNTNTASHSKLDLSVGGTSGGDPFIHFSIPSGREYSLGIDNSQSADELQLTTGASPSDGNELLIINDNQMRMTFGYAVDSKNSRIWCRNTGTTDAGSCVVAGVGGSATGDAFFTCEVEATRSFCFGIDNSSSKTLKINTDSASDVTPSSGANLWAMTTAGERTLPLQPAFVAQLSAQDDNVTGDGTSFTVGSNSAWTEITDKGGDFNTNGTFTAPITGSYYLSAIVYGRGFAAANNKANLTISTSNRTYSGINSGFNMADPTGDFIFGVDSLCDMDAADTAVLLYIVSNGTKVIDVGFLSRYSGFLFG